MTITLDAPAMPATPGSKLEKIKTAPPPVTFDTSYYEHAHGSAPHHAKRGTWCFQPPRHLGKRPFVFHDMTYGEARKQAEAAFGERPRYGGFVLIP